MVEDEFPWAEIENRIRVLLKEFRTEMLKEMYDRNLDPLKKEVDAQRDYCVAHSQELTEVKTRVAFLERAMVVVGSLAGTAFVTILIGLLTHQIKF